MKLCDSCKRQNCNKLIIITQQDDLTIFKCLEYEKDEEKVKGYTQPLWITAHQNKALMDLNI